MKDPSSSSEARYATEKLAAELYPSAKCHHMPVIEAICAGLGLVRKSVLPVDAGQISEANLMRLVRIAYDPKRLVVDDLARRIDADDAAIRLTLLGGADGLRQGLAAKVRG